MRIPLPTTHKPTTSTTTARPIVYTKPVPVVQRMRNYTTNSKPQTRVEAHGKNKTAHATPPSRPSATVRTRSPFSMGYSPRKNETQPQQTSVQTNMPHPHFYDRVTTTVKPSQKPAIVRQAAVHYMNPTVYALKPSTSTIPTTTVKPTQPTTTKIALTTTMVTTTTKKPKTIQPEPENKIVDQKEIFQSLPFKFTCKNVCCKNSANFYECIMLFK